MNTPPGLLGAAIVFWGWQTGHWLVAAPLAAVFEAARFVPQRWSFPPERLNRIGDLSVVLAGLLYAYLYFTLGNPRAMAQFFAWFPVAFLPLALSQAYGTHRDVDYAVFFWSMRRAGARNRRINVGYVYFALWILAATPANRRDGAFELGLFALAAWALWQARPRSRPVWLWLALVPLGGLLGSAGHHGLHQAQLWLEGNVMQWLGGEGGSSTNPYRADTDIGHIGELKQSARVVMRVRPGARLERPLLLHRASYDTYTGWRWLASSAAFTPIAQSGRAGTWPLADLGPDPAEQVVAVVEQTAYGNPVISLPAGARRIEELAASEMKQNPMGAVQVEHRPGFVPYKVRYLAGGGDASPPGRADLALPRRERAALDAVASQLSLASLPPAAAVAAVERHFAEGFRYSLYRAGQRGASSALAEFLLDTRAGHCEYFASATVLLLRAAGIPARYATGYSVQEWSDLEQAYVVRERHAHAWVRAWVDGTWREIDTTPAAWLAEEAAGAPWYAGAADLWAWFQLRFSEWQSREGDTPWTWIGVALALAIWIGWRLFGRPAQKARAAGAAAPALAAVGRDSPFYRIEAALGARGWERSPRETPREWLARIGPHLPGALTREELAALVALHYRYRFDPLGLAPAEREDFSARVDACLAGTRMTA